MGTWTDSDEYYPIWGSWSHYGCDDAGDYGIGKLMAQ